MEVHSTPIPGLQEIVLPRHHDHRGSLNKLFHRGQFAAAGLETEFPEEFVSVSRCGVIRGMHFQLPPFDHVKIVSCLRGDIFDVVVDLRLGSPTFRKVYAVVLSEREPRVLYVPRGLAHGFCAMSDDTTVLYRTSTVHSPEHDTGILWKSLPVVWPVAQPVISQRDSGFPSMADFVSPFQFR